MNTRVVTREEWNRERKELLAREKELTRLSDELARARRDLPRVEVTENYVFDGPGGRTSLADLFAGRSQLVVYHFMFGPEWEEGCKSCSFWADNYQTAGTHLAQRDVALVTVSRAPWSRIEAFQKRMGWTFAWVSSAPCSFNRDYGVSHDAAEVAAGTAYYNFRQVKNPGESPGLSVFARAEDGTIYHTYSSYARGLEALNTTYRILDLVPRGRDEEELDFTMAWVRHRDRYGVD